MAVIRLKIGDTLRDDDLCVTIDHGLAVVALEKLAAAFLNATLGVGEVVLRLRTWLAGGRRRCLVRVETLRRHASTARQVGGV